MTKASTKSKRSGVDAEDALLRPAARASTATAVTRPPQAATMVPRCMLPVTPQTADLSTRPPSSGSPGTRLSDADDQVGAGEALDGHQQQAVGRHEPQPERRRRRPRARSAGRRPRSRTPGAACRASPSIAVDAAEEVQRDRA